jgi:hypothetical protein
MPKSRRERSLVWAQWEDHPRVIELCELSERIRELDEERKRWQRRRAEAMVALERFGVPAARSARRLGMDPEVYTLVRRRHRRRGYAPAPVKDVAEAEEELARAHKRLGETEQAMKAVAGKRFEAVYFARLERIPWAVCYLALGIDRTALPPMVRRAKAYMARVFAREEQALPQPDD